MAVTYNAVADIYDEWSWQEFWRRNEYPVVSKIVSSDGYVETTVDVGSGTGAYAELCLEYTANYVGLDASLRMLQVMKRKVPVGKTINASAARLPLVDGAAQRMLAIRVLSHVSEIGRFFSEAARVLAPGSQLLVSDLDPMHHYREIRFYDLREKRIVCPLIPNKHAPAELAMHARKNSFVLSELVRMRFEDLAWQPPNHQFPALDRSNRHGVFFVMSLLRT